MNVIFRADANSSIGMGHIMRCLSIADAFKESLIGRSELSKPEENSIRFVLADDTVRDLVEGRGYEAVVLHTDYTDMDSELSSEPRDVSTDLIIVDSYYVTKSYLAFLHEQMKRSGGKLVYLDDVLSFPYPVDILIDYNAYAEESIYEGLYKNSEIKMPSLILGSSFAPIRSMFRGVEKKVQAVDIKNILISTGGSDELHLTVGIINYLKDRVADVSNSGCVYHFLIGTMNEDKATIHSLADEMNKGREVWIVLHENVSDMRGLISSCDLAVSAAGSTLYEICACGVPLITYALANNQIPGGEAFGRLGLGVYIGDLRDPESVDHNVVMSGELEEKAVQRIFTAIEELSADYEKRCQMGSLMQEMIDGFGADRMVREIIAQI